jgi:uncharacterized repeat protein (TIGR03803 family)
MAKSIWIVLVALVTLPPAGDAAAATTETVLYHFTGATGGNDKISGLIGGKSGVLYGTSYRGGTNGAGGVFQLIPPAKGKSIWSFSEIRTGFGTEPGLSASLAIDGAGVLYGTDSSSGPSGNGIVFKLTPPASGKGQWPIAILHSFTGLDGGYGPVSPVILDKQGALYGTAAFGGPKEGLVGYFGVVFKLTPPAKGHVVWGYSEIYSFAGGADGGFPVAGLVRDASGALYGTTQYAGTNNNGVVFKLTPPASGVGVWKETVLYRFRGGSDGSQPVASLALDGTGALYGTTEAGGSTSDSGHGIVFKLVPPAKGKAAWIYTVLHRFTGGLDGGMPVAGVRISDNALYGTTETGGVLGDGGNSAGNGVVFKLTPPAAGKTAWTETIVHDFAKGTDTTDGTNPTAGLIVDGAGGFFGTTSGGDGESLNGTIFKLSP